ncbi:transglycosylase domain-containing protein [Saccharopolyspora sp. NPDC050389]|uniref:transglycosylase domain-containing protein n=1 Tax=Saccharopolyspora sp. NPDC050389 TaxID=3155516 RepID=UPI0033EBC484
MVLPKIGKRWRRVRRIGLSIVGGLGLAVVGAFGVGYLVWEVPDPQQVAAGTQQSIVLKYADGSEMMRIVPESGNRTMIRDLGEVSGPMRQATLAAEDASFYTNGGFDFFGIVRAVFAQITGSAGGGSTLTQQYIKLATGDDEHSYARKFKEVVLAFKMTNEQPKDEIFKAYLNTAYYGRGAWGVHAAANAYFGKLPRDLNASEAALLAGMVQKPNENDPRVDAVQANWRWTYVADQMLSNGMVDPGQRAAMRMPETRERFAWRGEEMSGPLFHVRERVLQELEQAGFSAQNLHQNGNTVITTIDRDAQRVAESALAAETANQPQNLRTALVAIEPGTGAVRAYHSGDRQIGGFDWAKAAQPPGTTIQPFVVAAGLMQGHGLGEVYDGRSPQEINGATYRNTGSCPGLLACSVRAAMSESVETAFLNMTLKFGPGKVRDAALRAGISPTAGGKPAMQERDGEVGIRIAMGDYPVSTVDIARGYATLADGMRSQPHFVQKVLDSNGNELADFATEPESAFSDDPTESRDIAGNVTESMRWSYPSMLLNDPALGGLSTGRPVAGNSGIAQFGGSPDKTLTAWTAGFTPEIAVAVSVSASDEKGQPQPVLGSSGSMMGEVYPNRVWRQFMKAYLEPRPAQSFMPFNPIGAYSDPNQLPAPPGEAVLSTTTRAAPRPR